MQGLLVHRTRAVAIIATVAVSALALSACSGGSDVATPQPSGSSSASSASGTPEPSQTPSPSPSATTAGTQSPFSGRAGGAGKPVIVVKFDNTPSAQPHAGLRSADIVYIEEVEFGLTRLAAVFSTTLPPVVGPVRSARISDIDLLKQFGRPAFAYSGAQSRMRPLLGAASIYDVSGDKGISGYYRDRNRRAPYDFMGKPAQLLRRAPHASGAQDVGFVFAAATPAGGRAATGVTVSYPASSAQFVYDASSRSYDVRLNKKAARASEGGTQHATTVVIQYVKQYDSGFGDKFGGRTPKEETIGTGTGWVLRGGRAWQVTWSRPAGKSGTTYKAADGSVLAFAPGQVWIALVNRTRPATLS